MPAYSFTTLTEAIEYVRALGGSSIHTSGGRPPLPCCKHPKWTDITPEELKKRGRIAPCSCASQTDVSVDCKSVTWAHSEIKELDGAFVVYASPKDPGVTSESVVVDGVRVRLNRVPARDRLLDDEVTYARDRWPKEEPVSVHSARVAREVAMGRGRGG